MTPTLLRMLGAFVATGPERSCIPRRTCPEAVLLPYSDCPAATAMFPGLINLRRLAMHAVIDNSESEEHGRVLRSHSVEKIPLYVFFDTGHNGLWILFEFIAINL